jgi:hypothetical protein
MDNIKINDINEEMQFTEEELKHVKGGIALLLPAVQKVREASLGTTLTQKVLGDGSVKIAGDGSV